jgi:predicted DNA-binding transcriptional regulator AlpA
MTTVTEQHIETPEVDLDLQPGPPGTATLDDVARLLGRILEQLKADHAELLAAPEAAALCGVSRTSWFRMQSAGLIPEPRRLNGAVRWSRSELLDWTAAGCPSRRTWDAIRASKN